MKSPLKSEGRKERNGQTWGERESEGAMTHRERERERERGMGRNGERWKREEGHQKMERLRGMMGRERPPEGSVYTKHCRVCEVFI